MQVWSVTVARVRGTHASLERDRSAGSQVHMLVWSVTVFRRLPNIAKMGKRAWSPTNLFPEPLDHCNGTPVVISRMLTQYD